MCESPNQQSMHLLAWSDSPTGSVGQSCLYHAVPAAILSSATHKLQAAVVKCNILDLTVMPLYLLFPLPGVTFTLQPSFLLPSDSDRVQRSRPTPTLPKVLLDLLPWAKVGGLQ